MLLPISGTVVMRRQRRKACLGIALTILLGGSSHASPKAFETSPRRFGALVNRVLTRVSANFRFTPSACSRGESLECRFSSPHVTARIQGRSTPPRIERIALEADLFQDRPGADPMTLIADVIQALGATVVIFDPRLSADKRVSLLSDLTNSALEIGQSEAAGLDVHYSAIFDDAASGMLTVTVVPAE